MASLGVHLGLTCICVQPWAHGGMTWSWGDHLSLLQLALLGVGLLNSLDLMPTAMQLWSTHAKPQCRCTSDQMNEEGSRRETVRAFQL